MILSTVLGVTGRDTDDNVRISKSPNRCLQSFDMDLSFLRELEVRTAHVKALLTASDFHKHQVSPAEQRYKSCTSDGLTTSTTAACFSPGELPVMILSGDLQRLANVPLYVT